MLRVERLRRRAYIKDVIKEFLLQQVNGGTPRGEGVGLSLEVFYCGGAKGAGLEGPELRGPFEASALPPARLTLSVGVQQQLQWWRSSGGALVALQGVDPL